MMIQQRRHCHVHLKTPDDPASESTRYLALNGLKKHSVSQIVRFGDTLHNSIMLESCASSIGHIMRCNEACTPWNRNIAIMSHQCVVHLHMCDDSAYSDGQELDLRSKVPGWHKWGLKPQLRSARCEHVKLRLTTRHTNRDPSSRTKGYNNAFASTRGNPCNRALHLGAWKARIEQPMHADSDSDTEYQTSADHDHMRYCFRNANRS